MINQKEYEHLLETVQKSKPFPSLLSDKERKEYQESVRIVKSLHSLTENKKCPNCKNKILTKYKYCPFCGKENL